MEKIKLLILLMALSSFTAIFAQKNATGTVKDEKGEAMIGVNVLVKGTTNATLTDIDGKFILKNVSNDATLVISYIGYDTQEIKFIGQPTMEIKLPEHNKALDEVVVIGYGTVKRRDLTGSVASVRGDKLAANPVANVAQALQGQLPGVSVTSQDGRPGANISVRVRGGGSITQSNDPLFIVDGVQVSNINDIPADNIESIDVLKDAASTAIYGARGANGVILVTTKGAKSGKTSVHYNMYYQTKTNPKVLDVLNGYDYVFWTWAYAKAYGDSYGDGVAKYFGLGSSYGNHLNDYKGVKSHNFVNDIMRTAGSWNHDISLSSGNENTQLYATINYLNDEGIRIASGFSRWNANFKINQKVSKSLNFDADLRYTEIKTEGTNYDDATSAFTYRPIDNPLGDATYTAGLGQGAPNVELNRNPIDIINNYTNIEKDQTIRGRGALTWTGLKGIVVKSELSLKKDWTDTKYWNAGNNPDDTSYSLAKLTQENGFGVRWATTLNYTLQGLGEDHSASVLLGNEVLASTSNTSLIQGAGYPDGFTFNDAFGMISMTDPSIGKDQFSNTIGTPTHTQSWFGRANYSYKGRYLVTATFRADGSSKFAPNHHWGYFPAGAMAWRISDEGFMSGTRNWLDNLKLRLSYGTSGSDNISPSLWKETWQTKQIAVNGVNTTVYVPGDMLGNDNLKWETTISRNAGLDFGFLNNKIRGSIDAYWNITKNILMKIPVDPSSGYSYQFQNVGQTSNKGIELALGVDIVRSKGFNITFNATYNYNKNNIDKLRDDALADTHTNWGSTMRKPNYDYVIRQGKPVGLIQGFKSEGYYKVSDFDYDPASQTYTLKQGIPDTKSIVNYPTGIYSSFKLPSGQIAFPGMVKFAKTQADGGPVSDGDVTIIGETMAHHTGGFSLSGNWKTVDFSAGFTYQIGGKIYNANSMHSMMGNKDNDLGANRLAIVKDTYRVYDVDANGDLYVVTDPTALTSMNANAKYALNYSEYGLVSSEFVENASYLRLQDLTIGYTLPKGYVQKIGLSNLRIYATGTNLFCLSGYSGIDPDVNTNTNAGGNGFPTPNYDYNSYPKARAFTFGVNLTF